MTDNHSESNLITSFNVMLLADEKHQKLIKEAEDINAPDDYIDSLKNERFANLMKLAKEHIIICERNYAIKNILS